MADPHTAGSVISTSINPRLGEKRALAARISTYALGLALLAVILQSAVTALPTWGYFSNPDAGSGTEKGYFGPWRQCKYLLYGREKCGQGVSRFQPVFSVWISGLAAAGASVLLALITGLTLIQLAMASSAKRMVVSYSTAIIGKVALSTVATFLGIVAAGLFALQTDDKANSFIIIRGEGFYLQLASIALSFIILVSSIYEGIYIRGSGDPTKLRSIQSDSGTTITNPGYREHHHPTNGGAISMTDSSRTPYLSVAGNGSVASVATSGSVISVSSPLRSSLKKPRPLGIHNPGFSTHSPTFSRNGSQKKVRIQTHSTEV